MHILTNVSSRLLAGLALTAVIVSTPAYAGPYLLMDTDSGRVIAESDAGRPWYPASVTKLMTTYIAFRAMREGRAQPLTLLTVSENAQAQPPSKMGFKAGTTVTLDNAIKMLMVRSANDIAVVIAEGLGGGSVTSFVQDMNATAARLGMSGTHFVNPHGLPEENQVTTARDMAVLARALLQDFPEYEMYFRIPAIQMGKSIIRNHNRLIDRYPGADGMKTGFICSSGFNVVAGAKRGGKRLIVVVFGSYSAAQRSEDAARLFERGFRQPTLAAFTDNQFGTLQSIRNLPGAPHDMRDEMCNPKRKRPAAESDIDDEDDEVAELPNAEENRPGAAKQGKAKSQRPSLLGDLTPSMPPIRVYTGLPSSKPEEAVAATSQKPKTAAKPKVEGAAKSAAAKTGDTKPVREGDGAKPKAAEGTEKPKPAQASAPAAKAAEKTDKPKPAQASAPAAKPAEKTDKPAQASASTATAKPRVTDQAPAQPKK